MEQKNKFDTFDKPDDFDKILFDYYDTQKEDIPISTQKAIENAFKEKHKEKSTTITMLKRVAIFILSLGIISATTVYAKDIINFIITSIFTNSNPGIDKAVDNGYVQNVEMDFIKYNDVGVKVDYVLMDDKNLDISFVYKYFGETSTLKEIKYVDLSIKDEQNNIICFISESAVSDNTIVGSSIHSTNEQQFIDNSTIRDSLLVTSEKFPNSQTLYVEIQKITLTLDNEITCVNGDWNFSIELANNFVTRNSYEYSCNNSSYVNTVEASLNVTSLSINLQLNTLFDESTLYTRNSITLKDENNNTYRPTKMISQNTNLSEPYNSNISLIYPISVYNNINKLYLHINLDSGKNIDIELTK